MVSFESFSIDKPVLGIDQIRDVNPHRHEMELIDSVLFLEPDAHQIVGVKHVRDDEFWVRGHFPDGAIFPGVLMLEAAAQLASFYAGLVVQQGRRMVFGSATNVRFRGMVRPGDDLVVMATIESVRKTATRSKAQGFVGSDLVFEGNILGMLI